MEVIREREKQFPIIAVGTKIGLAPEPKMMKKEASAVVGEYDIPEVMEVSSKSGENVDEIFVTISKLMIRSIPQIKHSHG
jgi:translation elongation factor EF-4